MPDGTRDDERQELTHAAVPGYRTALWVAIGAAALYLAFVFLH